MIYQEVYRVVGWMENNNRPIYPHRIGMTFDNIINSIREILNDSLLYK